MFSFEIVEVEKQKLSIPCMRLLFLSPWYGWMSWMGNGCVCKCDVCKRHCYCYKPWHRHYFFFFPLILFTAPIWLSMANVHMRLRQDEEKGKGKRMAWFPAVVHLYRSEPCCSSTVRDVSMIRPRSVVPLGYG